MDKRYLIDTNIIIYYLDNNIPLEQLDFIETIFKNSFKISTITKIELLGWNKITIEVSNKIQNFLSYAEVIYINQSIEQKTIEIKQKHTMQIADSIIAATCLVDDLILITRNTKDFETIKDLQIFNPYAKNIH